MAKRLVHLGFILTMGISSAGLKEQVPYIYCLLPQVLKLLLPTTLLISAAVPAPGVICRLKDGSLQ